MAQNTINTEGTVNSARGVNPLNAVANVDPRKAVIFTSVSAALTAVTSSMRAEGLPLMVRNAQGGIDEYQFVGGTEDADFKRKTAASVKIKEVYLQKTNNGTTIQEYAANAINELPKFDIAANEVPFFHAIGISGGQVGGLNENTYAVLTFRNRETQGSFGVGETPVTASDIQLISRFELNTINLENSNPTYYNLGNIGSTAINTAVNQNSYTIAPNGQGFSIFTATQNDIEKSWLYLGQSGDIGGTDYLTTLDDFSVIPKKASTVNKEQIILSGGNYNNFITNGNIIIFNNTNAQAIITGFDNNTYKRLTLINNSNFELRLNSEDSNSDVNKRIKLPTGLVSIGVESTCELVYIDSIQKWQIVDSFASKYRPEHRGLTEARVEVVLPNAISETREIIELIVFRDAQTTPMSKADLNNPSGGYPNAKRGFQVVCKEIDTIYIKVDDNNHEWQSITTGGNVL